MYEKFIESIFGNYGERIDNNINSLDNLFKILSGYIEIAKDDDWKELFNDKLCTTFGNALKINKSLLEDAKEKDRMYNEDIKKLKKELEDYKKLIEEISLPD